MTHQSAACLPSCLDSALRFTNAGVVVVDNSSTDTSVEIAANSRGVTLIANSANRGFAAAVNQGFNALTDADVVLLLNPDAVLLSDLAPLERCFDDPQTAAATGMLCDESGAPQRGFTFRRFPTPAALCFENLGINRLWPSNPINRKWRCLDMPLDQECQVDQPAGAFLLVRRAVWKELGGFDERFHPVWFEDVDFCLRVRQKGYTIWYKPAVSAAHQGGHSVRAVEWTSRQVYWNQNLLRFASLHFGLASLLLIAITASIGAVVRGSFEAVRRGSPGPLRLPAFVVGAGVATLRRALSSTKGSDL